MHGAPLGDEEVAATREHIGWNYPPFEIPADVYAGWDAQREGRRRSRGAGTNSSPRTRRRIPELAAEFERRMRASCPPIGWTCREGLARRANDKAETIATRKASQNAINALAPALPEFLGGSADLTGSNLTNWTGVAARVGQRGRRQLHQLRRARIRHGARS